VAVALVGRVQHDQSIEHGHHGTAVTKDGHQARKGTSRRPDQAKQAGNGEHGGVVDQGYGGLETRVRPPVAPCHT
jgi:hypothetical protein